MRRHDLDAPVWFLAGLIFLPVALGPRAGPNGDKAGRGSTPSPRAARVDPDAFAARELRALPGIGPARALAIVEARWGGLRGGPTAWTSLSGIGDATAAAVQQALSSAAVEPPREHAYTRRESP